MKAKLRHFGNVTGSVLADSDHETSGRDYFGSRWVL